jgi:DNA helicase-2/ATP-dependent DNA helicase PcrA
MSTVRTNRQSLNDSFQATLERLNPAQRSAVETLEGPVMVVAGPGTGKTHILAARIGKILLETDAQASNILCLTFTDAGVLAMRERLLQFIGPEAHRVHLYTFHSFCNTVIQDNLELFGRQDLEPLSDLDRIDLVRTLLDELDVEHPLRRGQQDAYFYESHLQDLFQRLKMEDWAAEYVLEQIDLYLTSLPDRPDYRYQRNQGAFKKGDLKVAKFQEENLRMKKLRAAVELYPAYETAKNQARRYDFNDMILWVLRAFEADEFLLRRYQEQYLYVLVDEYQDTNGAQNEILLQLINYWDSPNIFIVGDDDQSIFEFQGARLKSLTDFFQKYADNLHTVALVENYRSPQTLLDAAENLIDFNTLRVLNQLQTVGLEKKLLAKGASKSQLPFGPSLVSYPNRLQEETDVVTQVKNLSEQGVPWEDIAILYAQHRQIRNVIPLLEKNGIPYQTRRGINVLELPLIQSLIQFLEYLLLEMQQPFSGEQQLFKLLQSRFLDIPSAELAQISLFINQLAYRQRPHWRSIIQNRQSLQDLNLPSREKLAQFGVLLDELIADAVNLPLPELLEKTINSSGWLAFLLHEPDHPTQIQVLNSFFSFVQEEYLRRPKFSIQDLLSRVQRMEANRIPLPLVRQVDVNKGVHLLTAHSAKGLEFGYVFMIDGVQDYWESKTRNNAYRFSFPDTLTLSGESDALEARRRLFYVAMTRAQHFLQISYALQNEQGKPLQRAVFLDELETAAGLVTVHKTVPEIQLQEAQLLRLLALEKPRISSPPKEILDALLQDFRLHVTAFNTYLYCPLAFYFEQVIRVPSLISEAAVYGIAAHEALQRLFSRMLLSREHLFPSEKEFLSYFEFALQAQRSQLTESAYQRQLEIGQRKLKRYYQYYYGRWSKKVRVEYQIRQVEVDGVPLTGTIDKLEFLPQLHVSIVDYKTGTYQPAKLRRPSAASPHGGSFWRQLVFYKILYEAFDRSSRTVSHGEIAYLEPNAEGQFPEIRISFAPDDVIQLRRLIKETYDKIINHQFFKGCGRPECQWCGVVRREALPGRLSRVENEELDDGK